MAPGWWLALLAVVALGYALLAPTAPSAAAARPRLSAVDGEAYRVQPAQAGPGAAADLLARLNARALALLAHLRRRHGGGRGPRAEAAARLRRRYDPDRLAENAPGARNGETAYALNKGELLALCLRDARTGALHPEGLLFFVYLHELAHLAAEVEGHPPEFWATFRWLLEEAEAAGVYESPDFAAAPSRYCGVEVDYNPRWDPAQPPLGGN